MKKNNEATQLAKDEIHQILITEFPLTQFRLKLSTFKTDHYNIFIYWKNGYTIPFVQYYFDQYSHSDPDLSVYPYKDFYWGAGLSKKGHIFYYRTIDDTILEQALNDLKSFNNDYKNIQNLDDFIPELCMQGSQHIEDLLFSYDLTQGYSKSLFLENLSESDLLGYLIKEPF